MTFEEWLKVGIDNKWCSPPVCAMHEITPITQEEEYEIDEGSDPCYTVVRLFEIDSEYDDAKENSPLAWKMYEA